MSKVLIDLNNPIFQKDLFALNKAGQASLIKTLRKITQLTWQEVYQDQGLKWELIMSKTAKDSNRLYSFRFSQKGRVVALREGDYLRLLTLHPDHDSAYH